MNTSKLSVVSIFPSVDGEVNAFGQGVPTCFIRLAGCNLRCWRDVGGCDTPQALDRESGALLSAQQVFEDVEKTGLRKVTITGGEPLLQKENLGPLLVLLDKEAINISVETNGSIMPDFEGDWAVDSWVYDHKCPSSGENEKMIPIDSIYSRLREVDYLKFVISNGDDYDYALKKVKGLPYRPTAPRIAFSPREGGMTPADLVSRMLDDRLSLVQLNLQIHKYIWPLSVVER